MDHTTSRSPSNPDPPGAERSAPSHVLRHLEADPFVFREHQVRCRRENPRHKHDYECIGFILAGLGTAELARESWTVRPGNLNIIPRDVPHAERFGSAEIRWCGIELFRVRDEYASAVRAVFSKPQQVTSGPAVDIARRIQLEMRIQDGVSSLALSGLGLELLAALTRNGHNRDDRPGPAWLHRAEELLRARCLDPMTLHDVALEVGVHPIHLARTFRAVMGCSIGEFLRDRRIEHAKELLADFDLPLSFIALDTGFSDQSHFTRVFRRLTGLTPNAYRRSLRSR